MKCLDTPVVTCIKSIFFYSADDLLYSNILSDDDFPEIMLPEDSVFKRSLQPSISNSFSEAKSNCDSSKSGQSSMHMKVQDTRASLSSSPAVSEGSHCSSLLRSTDDESISDIAWKDSILPVPPPRKNTPANLQLNQSFLHSSLDRKQMSSMSESSGVSSAASTSPTNAVDTSQCDPGNLYTSTAVVTLAGQKSPTQCARATASSTAELRRQFFELPPPLPTGTPPLTSRPSSQSETAKYSSESGRDSESSLSCTDIPLSLRNAFCEVDGASSRRDSEQCQIQGTSTRPRGSSLSYASTVDTVSSNSFYGREDKTSGSAEISYSLKMESRHIDDTEKGIDSVDCRAYMLNKTEKLLQSDGKKRTEVISVKHMVQNIDMNPKSAISSDFECLNSVVSNKKLMECNTISTSSILNESLTLDRSELKSIKSGDKLSLNRQPRFV
ncbi:uncharacterized protein [Parasteatoda tepidariorum]|uniref:uncharacterized protein n=1 Tax=Parasteatoda tepidariorum TaxID=114398 RepID=UPI001C72635C|nr:uncharacterized protein LOC122270460 [Parasteatoda tepidariorum]